MSATALYMAGAVQGWDGPAGTTLATGSISPGTNCVLVAFMGGVPATVGEMDAMFPGDTVVSSGSGPTWDRLAYTSPSVEWESQIGIWYAVVGDSDPGGFTVTWDPDIGANEIGAGFLAVYRVTGCDLVDPIRGYVTEDDGAASNHGGQAHDSTGDTITLPATPGEADVTLAAVYNDCGTTAGSTTFGSSAGTWTKDYDFSASGKDIEGCVGQRSTSSSTSVVWSDIGSWPYSCARAAVTIRASGLNRTPIGTYDFSDATAGAHGGNCDLGTVTTGDLVILYAAAAVEGSPSPPMFDLPSKASGTATIGTVTLIDEEGVIAPVAAWRFSVTAGGTLTMSVTDAVTTYGIWVLAEKWTGHNTTTPVAASTVAQSEPYVSSNFDPASVTLGEAPAAGDYVRVWVNAVADAGSGRGWTPGTGFTEVTEVGDSTADLIEANLSSRTESTSTTVNWPTDTAGGPTRYSVSGIAFILKADTGALEPWLREAGRGFVVPATLVRASAW